MWLGLLGTRRLADFSDAGLAGLDLVPVGGRVAGHLYGHVTDYDPPVRWATRGQLSAGTTLDSDYQLTDVGDGAVQVHVVKVAVGPLTEEEAAGIADHGDYRPFAAAIEKLANR